MPAAATLAAHLDPLNLSRAIETIADFPRGSASPQDAARDEDFWAEVARAFTVERTIVNLNNGNVCPAPRAVQEAMQRHLEYSNSSPPAMALWAVLAPRREPLRKRIARHWGVDAEEGAFTRNASESLQICQFGMKLKAGDEVLASDQDYPLMLDAFRQRQNRDGVVLRLVSLPVPCEDEEELVARYERSITPRTRLILVSHMIYLTGQIMPVRKLVQAARRRGIPVIVDGAHALAHIPFKISDLDCDYYGTSLHKWLFAPHGTGLLYVRREKIRELWPLMAAGEGQEEDIRKFEQIGTHPEANTMAVADALTFHQAIGDERKAARLHYLKKIWAERLTQFSDRVILNTSLDPRFSCGMATVRVDGIDSGRLSYWLWKEHRILTAPWNRSGVDGQRISPCVYTTMEEIDRFCDAMEHAITHGLPA